MLHIDQKKTFYISTFVNFYSIYYLKKFRADTFYPRQISNAHIEASKNQLIYNLNKYIISTYGKMKDTSANTSSEATIFFDKNVMATIDKLKMQDQLASI